MSNKEAKDIRARTGRLAGTLCAPASATRRRTARDAAARADMPARGANARRAPAPGPHRVRRRGCVAGEGDGPRDGLGSKEGLEPGVVDAAAEPGDAEGGSSVCFLGFVALYHCHPA
jgi:hypothetical protein